MATDCQTTRGMMQAALDGELGTGARASFDAHLATCDACREEYSSYEMSLRVLMAVPVPEPGPSFASTAVRRAVQARQVQARRHRRLTWTMAACIAACSIVALGAWAGILQPVLWDVVTWVPRTLAGSWSLVGALSGTLATLSRALLPLGNLAAGLAWDGLLAFLPLYALAFATMVFITIATRLKRPAARLPVLSL